MANEPKSETQTSSSDLGPTLADVVKRLAAHEDWSKAELKKIEERLTTMTPAQQKEVIREVKEAAQEDKPFDLFEWLGF